MRTPVPSKAEGFKLTDDCTLSGRRLHRDERSAQPVRGSDRASSAGGGVAQGGEHCSRVEGGGYVDLTTPFVPSGRSRPTGSIGEVPMECRQRARHALLPAHGVVLVRAAGMKSGEKEVLSG